MEKPLYPSSYMRITQGYNIGSHKDSYAIDDAGQDQNISYLKAPFTGTIKKIYPQDANEVWLESTEPVEYPDGTIDYMTIMFAHSNDVSNLFVGKLINRGEEFYSEGTKGQVTGNHCHIECGRGKFTGTGWFKNSNGNYSINNGKKPEECLWLDNSISVIDNNGYNFKMISTSEELPELSPEQPADEPPNSTPKPPQEITTPPISMDSPKLIFTCLKDGLYGVYLKDGESVYLKRKNKS